MSKKIMAKAAPPLADDHWDVAYRAGYDRGMSEMLARIIEYAAENGVRATDFAKAYEHTAQRVEDKRHMERRLDEIERRIFGA